MGRSEETTGALGAPITSSEPAEGEAQTASKWQIEITPTALKMLASVKDTRTKGQIVKKIDDLAGNPDQLGKPLDGELTGYHSTRAAQQRYRIIYRIDAGKVTVYVVAAAIRREGHKRDVYALAKKLVQARLLDIADDDDELPEDGVSNEKA